MRRRLLLLLVLAWASPALAQSGDQLPATAPHTFSFALEDNADGLGKVSVELQTRSSRDQINMPAALKFAPGDDVSFLGLTNVTIATAVGSRRERERGIWEIEPPRAFTLTAKRMLVSSPSLAIAIAPYATLSGSVDPCRGATLSTWVSNGVQEISLGATVAHDRDGEMSRTVYANYGQTFHRRLRAMANLAYTAGGGNYWMSASETMTYQIVPGFNVDVLLRHEGMDAALDSSVNINVRVRLGT
jgi:hypothetical protein